MTDSATATPNNPADDTDIIVAAVEKAYDQVTSQEATDAEQSQPERTGGPARDERGRFVAAGGKEQPEQPAAAEEEAGTEKSKPETQAAPKSKIKGKAAANTAPETEAEPQQPDKAPADKDIERPPPSFSVKSKADWDKLPPHVRQDILRREREVSDGFKLYEGLGRYAERARNAGQTLAQALEAYTGIEDLLRRDVAAGLLHIAQNCGLTQYQASLLFADLAQRLGYQGHTQQTPSTGVPPDQNGSTPNELQHLLANAMQPILQRMQTLEQSLTQQAQADQRRRETAARDAIEKFRTDPAHRFYDNVEADIARLLETGIVPRTGNMLDDLAKAYELACWQNPEIRELLINEQTAKAEESRRAAVERAKRAGKSVHSAAAEGISKPLKVPDGKDPIDAAVEHAFSLVSGAA